MKTVRIFRVFFCFLVAALPGHAQSIFQNLNFEDGNLSNPSGVDNKVLIT
jgi:hypothetical protein